MVLTSSKKKVTVKEIWSIIYMFYLLCHTYRSYNSSILALTRFMARRGAVRSIWSDNGTNFVGTRNELQQGFKEMSHDKIKNFLQENGADWIDWHHNPPPASHMGGI